MAIGLPSVLSAGPMSDESCLTTIGAPDQVSPRSVDAILKALSPLKIQSTETDTICGSVRQPKAMTPWPGAVG